MNTYTIRVEADRTIKVTALNEEDAVIEAILQWENGIEQGRIEPKASIRGITEPQQQ
jgi:hypothetical protein